MSRHVVPSRDPTRWVQVGWKAGSGYWFALMEGDHAEVLMGLDGELPTAWALLRHSWGAVEWNTAEGRKVLARLHMDPTLESAQADPGPPGMNELMRSVLGNAFGAAASLERSARLERRA